MSISTVVSWMLCGLTVGLIARLLVPGRQTMGAFPTMFLGIVGAALGGLVYSVVVGDLTDPFTFEREAWPGWALSLLGAMITLVIYATLTRARGPLR